MTKKRAEEIRRDARAILDEKLRQQLDTLQDRCRVTEEELEVMVKTCVEEVGQDVLGRLLAFEEWVEEAENVTHCACPTCRLSCPRKVGEDGEREFEDFTLETTLGPVPWRAPLFYCKECRRSFSPGASLL